MQNLVFYVTDNSHTEVMQNNNLHQTLYVFHEHTYVNILATKYFGNIVVFTPFKDQTFFYNCKPPLAQ